MCGGLPGARCSGVMDLNVPQAGGGDVVLKAKGMSPRATQLGRAWAGPLVQSVFFLGCSLNTWT